MPNGGWTFDPLLSDFGVIQGTVDRRGVASVDAYIAFSHRFGSSAQTPLGHAQRWIRREAYHASNPYRHLLWLVQTQTLVFRLRAQTSGASVVVRLYELGGWASGVHQKTMQTMGIRLLRLWAGVCLASVSCNLRRLHEWLFNGLGSSESSPSKI